MTIAILWAGTILITMLVFYVSGYLHGRRVFSGDNACTHCPPCDCNADCDECAQAIAEEIVKAEER